MICPNCNTYFEDDFAFCPKCGAKLELSDRDWNKYRNENGNFTMGINGRTIESDSFEELISTGVNHAMSQIICSNVDDFILDEEYEKAFEQLFLGLSNEPKNEEFRKRLYTLVRKCTEKGKYGDSMRYILEVFNINDEFGIHDDDDILYYFLGSAASLSNDYEIGLNCFAKAIEINPNIPEYWINQGIILQKVGDELFESEIKNAENVNMIRLYYEKSLYSFNQAQKIEYNPQIRKIMDDTKIKIINMMNYNSDRGYKVCAKCGEKNSINRTYCERCGTDFP